MGHVVSELKQYTEDLSSYERAKAAEALIEMFPQLIQCGFIQIDDPPKEESDVSMTDDPLKGENEASMIAHKQWLKNEWLKLREDNYVLDTKTVTQKMELCFPYRRKEIDAVVSLFYLKNEYPFMFTYQNILKEFELLMSMDLEKIFLSNAIQLAPSIMNLLSERRNSKDIATILKDFNSIPSEVKKPNDEVTACLLILPYLFSLSNYVYKIYKSDTSEHNRQLSIKKGPNDPHVAVIGSPFSSTEVYVVFEGEIILKCSTFIEGIIACFTVYYCCNIKYPKQVKDIYLFIQTQFLNLEYDNLPLKITFLADRIKKDIP